MEHTFSLYEDFEVLNISVPFHYASFTSKHPEIIKERSKQGFSV